MKLQGRWLLRENKGYGFLTQVSFEDTPHITSFYFHVHSHILTMKNINWKKKRKIDYMAVIYGIGFGSFVMSIFSYFFNLPYLILNIIGVLFGYLLFFKLSMKNR
jgi:hypothetical protein